MSIEHGKGKNFKLIDRNFLDSQNTFSSNDKITKSVSHLKDKKKYRIKIPSNLLNVLLFL